jgi:hypothetical protein
MVLMDWCDVLLPVSSLYIYILLTEETLSFVLVTAGEDVQVPWC